MDDLKVIENFIENHPKLKLLKMKKFWAGISEILEYRIHQEELLLF